MIVSLDVKRMDERYMVPLLQKCCFYMRNTSSNVLLLCLLLFDAEAGTSRSRGDLQVPLRLDAMNFAEAIGSGGHVLVLHASEPNLQSSNAGSQRCLGLAGLDERL